MAYFFYNHEAFSQVYFMYVSIFFLNLFATGAFDFKCLRLKNIMHYCIIVLSFITAMCFYINFCGSGLRQYLYHYDIIEKYPYRYVVKSEDELAGEYLRKNMSVEELFVTNHIHTGRGEGLSNVYTCFSGKQSYMEGFKYTVSNMGIDWDIVKPRYDFINELFTIGENESLTFDDIVSFCKQYKIRYAVFSHQFEGDDSKLDCFEAVFSQGTVTIYKLY
jgi:hypothetical protein